MPPVHLEPRPPGRPVRQAAPSTCRRASVRQAAPSTCRRASVRQTFHHLSYSEWSPGPGSRGPYATSGLLLQICVLFPRVAKNPRGAVTRGILEVVGSAAGPAAARAGLAGVGGRTRPAPRRPVVARYAPGMRELDRLLDGYQPAGPGEEADVARLRELLAGRSDPWSRDAPLHVTGSAVIIHPDIGRVLLRWHQR